MIFQAFLTIYNLIDALKQWIHSWLMRERAVTVSWTRFAGLFLTYSMNAPRCPAFLTLTFPDISEHFKTVLIWRYRETPLLVPGVDQNSDFNIFVKDQIIEENKK